MLNIEDIFGNRPFRKKRGQKIPKRPSWDDFFLKIAADYSLRATCLRRQYGAVIVDDKKRIVSAGYCGAPRGVVNCIELGFCYREKNKIPTGERYEACMSVHAEENAILFADDKTRLEGSKIYVACWDVQKQEPAFSPPCLLCAKKIVQVGIESVILLSKDKDIRKISVSDLKEKLSRGDFSYPY